MTARITRREKPQPRIIDSRNRFALTREALEALDVGPGDYLFCEVHGTEVRLIAADIVPRKR